LREPCEKGHGCTGEGGAMKRREGPPVASKEGLRPEKDGYDRGRRAVEENEYYYKGDKLKITSSKAG